MSEARTREHERERRQLYAFLDANPGFPAERIKRHETPDFLLRTADGVLGLQLGELALPAAHDESIRIRHEMARRTTFELARKLLGLRDIEPLELTLRFAPGAAPEPERRPVVARAIYHTILCAASSLGDSDETLTLLGGGSLPSEIDRLTVHRRGHGRECQWRLERTASEEPTLLDLVRALVAREEAPGPRYRELCDACWLLITLPIDARRFDWKPAELVASLPPSRCFERVLLHDEKRGWTVDLARDTSAAAQSTHALPEFRPLDRDARAGLPGLGVQPGSSAA